MPPVVKTYVEEPPRALLEMARFDGNPEINQSVIYHLLILKVKAKLISFV